MDAVDPEWIRELDLIEQFITTVESGKQAYEWDVKRREAAVFLANLSLGSAPAAQQPRTVDLDRDDPWCTEEVCS